MSQLANKSELLVRRYSGRGDIGYFQTTMVEVGGKQRLKVPQVEHADGLCSKSLSGTRREDEQARQSRI
jgi:hypothetical protein